MESQDILSHVRGNKYGSYQRDLATSPAVYVVTETGILSQNLIFS